MTPCDTAALLREFASITLDELVEQASLQTRVDRKYLLPVDRLHGVLSDLDPGIRVLQIGGARAFRYESVYFDTPELTSYWMAAHQRRRRVKIRTRSYLDSGLRVLEVKTRGARGTTVKDRPEIAIADPTRLDDVALDYIAETLRDCGIGGIDPRRLAPTLTTRYLRSTL